MRTFLLLLSLSLLISTGKAQNGPFLFDEQLLSALQDQRLRANAQLLSAGNPITWKEFELVSSDAIDSLQAQFFADSIHWQFTISGIPFTVRVPNDISLLLGADRGELQDFLLEQLGASSLPLHALNVDTVPIDTVWRRNGLRFEVLQHISISDSLDSTSVCHSSYPVASAISAINDTLSCNGLYPVKLVFNRYGYRRDTVATDITSIMRITGAVAWEKWFAVEGEELTVMLQHPYFAFDHMLFLRKQEVGSERYWLGEMHSFIPSHNLGDLYGKYTQKEGAERFEIK